IEAPQRERAALEPGLERLARGDRPRRELGLLRVEILDERVDGELLPGGLGLEAPRQRAERIEAEAEPDRIEAPRDLGEPELAAGAEPYDVDGRGEEVEARRLERERRRHALGDERVAPALQLGALGLRQDLAQMLRELEDARTERRDLGGD